MARIQPFAALRYDRNKVGALENVITQPYDKITPQMIERYRGLSPYNLSWVIKNADYADAARRLREWTEAGVLRPDPQPAIYPYFLRYRAPGTSTDVTRKGFIAAGKLEPYEAGVVFRHERTLTGPKQDRLQLLRATRAHFGQLFMLYSDPTGEIDQRLDTIAASEPVEQVRDEYGAEHTVWRVAAADAIQSICRAMADKKLIIADGHHRYETALAFRDECRRSQLHKDGGACEAVMMTFVNMDVPGLTILPTHRLLARFPKFDRERFLTLAGRYFEVMARPLAQGMRELGTYGAGQAIGVALSGATPEFLLLRLRPATDLAELLPEVSPEHRALDVVVLHQVVLKHCLGIDEEAVKEEKFIEYLREYEKGWEAVAAGAPACFFLNPVRIEQMRQIAFAGGVMPQKSTDFYPKLLSGLTGYRVED